ncbi:OadG-related small transporter subunit [Fundicoccus ignavus]|mgnify:FL=1|nr:OadG-related small transporter subunit [Fundicoccus ignavus]
MNFDPALITKALELMVLGMGGIFLVLGALYGVSLILLKMFPGEE